MSQDLDLEAVVTRAADKQHIKQEYKTPNCNIHASPACLVCSAFLLNKLQAAQCRGCRQCV